MANEVLGEMLNTPFLYFAPFPGVTFRPQIVKLCLCQFSGKQIHLIKMRLALSLHIFVISNEGRAHLHIT